MGKTPHSTRKVCRLIFYLVMKKNIISQAGESACVPLQSQTNPPQHILVVDDARDLRRLNAGVLKRSGCPVDTAEDGEAGGKVLHAVSHASDSYDLLITAPDMPGLSDPYLVKQLRAARMAPPVLGHRTWP
jgi:PleD family two-component response regulator